MPLIQLKLRCRHETCTPFGRDYALGRFGPNLTARSGRAGVFSRLWAHDVRGAKPRANMELRRIEPGLADEKWRISADTITVASACCTCVPGVLPLLPNRVQSV